MYTFKVKRDSWHYLIAGEIGGFRYVDEEDHNFCRYVAHFVKGLIMAASVIAMILLVVGFIGRGVYEIFMRVVYDKGTGIGAAGLVVGFVVLITIVTFALKLAWMAMVTTAEELLDIIIKVSNLMKNRKESKESQVTSDVSKEPTIGFLRMWYSKIKDKTCVKVEIVDE